MAIVTSDFLNNVLTNFKALFASDFLAAQALQGWQQLANRVPSNGDQNIYNWYGTVPKMVDVTHGSVEFAGLKYYNFTISNLEYQNGILVERTVFERDNLNLVRPKINQLALEAARHPGELILNLVLNNSNAYDGAAFFADTRTIGDSANIDNQLAGTGTTVAQFQADLAAARSAMRKFQDDKGRPMNLIGNVIMVPPELEQLAWQSLNANQGSLNQPVVPASKNGILEAGGYIVVANPFLTDPNNWYLFHVGPGEDKPFIWQVEKDPELQSETNPNSAFVIENRKFMYSAYARYNVGFTDPRFGVLTTNT